MEQRILCRIYLGYMYARWRKIRGLDEDDQQKIKDGIRHHSKDFEKIKWVPIYLSRM